MQRLQTMVLVTAVACTLAAAHATASVDLSPKPGGVFLLKPGVFVTTGQTCEDPANAGIRWYDGKGIHGTATHACIATIVAKKGKRFTVDQSCVDTPAGEGPQRVERQTITIEDALTFVIGRGAKATRYRYCPTYELPAGLKGQ
ncbi:hypothetical protein [Pseudomonas sp. RIT-PI-S]|uniref:hypothetical protein n=1 Tax=Pseudomonas sp. RIT-PI-S TaxID=3035295 RepID=UPI0021DAFA0B|nr:hypothetical protein [Pseudomonas sp. RIT-PI-S]